MNPGPDPYKPLSTPGRGLVELTPLGRMDQTAVAVVAANIQTLLGIDVDVMPPLPEPDYAWLPTRSQYDAGPILKKLAADAQRSRIRLGLTAGDLCLPILTHVFGEAQMGGSAAVISIFRLGNVAPGRPVASGQVFERLIKVALHEVCHVIGLPHCQSQGCLMKFSQKLEHLDQLNIALCPDCQSELARLKKRFD